MDLTIGKEKYEVRFDYRASREIKKIKYDSAEGMGAVIQGLLDSDPDTIAALYGAGLSYLKAKRPGDDVIFDAVSNLFDDVDAEKVAQDLMNELVASGFFRSQVKVWLKNQKKYLQLYADRLFVMKENAEEEQDSNVKQDLIGKVNMQEEMKKELEQQLSTVESLITSKK